MRTKVLDIIGKICYNILVEKRKEVISCLNNNRCENCIWYEDCKEFSEECEYFDPVIEDEPYWLEMSYRKYKEGEE